MTTRMKILIVEDDDDSRQLLSSSIRRKFQDLDVHTARNGREALDVLPGLLPEMVLTDINMPQINGIQLAQEVRELRPATVMMAITAHSDQEVTDRCREHGVRFDEFIFKPLHYASVFEAIERCVEKVHHLP